MEQLKSISRTHTEQALRRLKEHDHKNQQIFNMFGLDIREYGDWLVDSVIALIALTYCDGSPKSFEAVFETVCLYLEECRISEREGTTCLSVEGFIESLLLQQLTNKLNNENYETVL